MSIHTFRPVAGCRDSNATILGPFGMSHYTSIASYCNCCRATIVRTQCPMFNVTGLVQGSIWIGTYVSFIIILF